MPMSATTRDRTANFAADVCNGLGREGQKKLPSKYFYDAVGSALFEAISLLPEYGLTRADERLLRAHSEEIVERIPSPALVAELGSGTGKKTRWLLQALCRRQATCYYPIEISRSALATCRQELGNIDSISIFGFECEYLDGLAEVAQRRGDRQRILVLFLGSTIGNFDRSAALKFLADARGILQPGDFLLLGADLEKPVQKLIEAYDDSRGITAAFNRNLLARINRELGGDFDLGAYEHMARYDQKERRIEMHLRARSRQTVAIEKAGLRVTIEQGETIWTESSHKYSPEEPVRMARASGFECVAQWFDPEWAFAESLFSAE
jgi:L-histidine N-alpha-methyltransferase